MLLEYRSPFWIQKWPNNVKLGPISSFTFSGLFSVFTIHVIGENLEKCETRNRTLFHIFGPFWIQNGVSHFQTTQNVKVQNPEIWTSKCETRSKTYFHISGNMGFGPAISTNASCQFFRVGNMQLYLFLKTVPVYVPVYVVQGCTS